MRAHFRLLLAASLALGFCLSSCNPRDTPKANEASSTQTANKEESPLGLLAPGEPLTGIPVEADDARQGSEKALVTIVAFLDFQCSFCREGFATLMQLRSAYTDEQLRIVFKHLPLRSHPEALPAAIAGQTVNDVGGSDAFFQFARLAFEGNQEISYENLGRWATEAGVPRELYNERVGEQSTLLRVAQDAGLAHQVGIDSTPSFFVNGRLLAGAQPLEVFHQTLQEELAFMKASTETSWRNKYQSRVAGNMKESLVAALLAEDPGDLRVPVGNSPVSGNSDALVTLVVFTDFECPFCKRSEGTVKTLQKKYGPDLRVVFKHLPLPFHSMARPTALVAEAIYKKAGSDAFFLAAGELFSNSPELGRETLTQVGSKYGLTQSEIKDAIEERSSSLLEQLEEDRILADDVLARGTPHFFINGKRLSGARPIGHFEALIEHEKKRAQARLLDGTPKANLYESLQKDASSPGAPQKLELSLTVDGQPTRGNEKASIAVHIFSDFECPFCQQGEVNLALLAKKYPQELRFVWHDLPLPFHERALPAARAARFAFKKLGNTGFWKMHASLFNLDSDSSALSDNDIRGFGVKLGLNPDELVAALSDPSRDEGIEKDIALADSLGINGTPAYVIGGYLVTGARPLNHLDRVVKLALAEGTKPKEETPTRVQKF